LARGRACQAEGRWDEAAATFQRCAKEHPDVADAWLGLAEVEAQLGRHRSASAALRKAVSTVERPSSVQESLALFQALMRLGRLDEAFALGREIRRRDKRLQTAGALTWPWGLLAPHVGDASSALRPVRRSVEDYLARKPRDAWGRYYRGILRRRLGEEPGREDLEAAVRWASADDAWMTFELGRARLYARDFKGALSAFSSAARATEPADWKAYAFRAEAYACMRKPARALRELERAVAATAAAERGDALAWKGQVELWLGRPDAALRTLDEAIRLGGRYAFAWRGAAKIRLGRPREALADLDRAIELKYWDFEAWVWRGEAKRLLKDFDGALADLDRALEPATDPWALMNRGLVHAALGREDLLERDAAGIGRDLRDAIAALLPKKKTTSQLLEAGLAMNHGCRRGAGYACACWFDIKPTEVSPP